MTIVARKLFLGTATPLISLSSVLSSLSLSLSSSSSSSSSVTMMALTAAGTSRTLIEIGNNNININNNDDDINNQKEFDIDVSYLDNGDYENGLPILRRRVVDGSNTATAIGFGIEDEDKFGSCCQVDSGSMMAHNTKSPHNKSVLYQVSTTFKKMKMQMQMNPFVASSSTCICICILVMGNIASMIGIVPIGLYLDSFLLYQ